MHPHSLTLPNYLEPCTPQDTLVQPREHADISRKNYKVPVDSNIKWNRSQMYHVLNDKTRAVEGSPEGKPSTARALRATE